MTGVFGRSCPDLGDFPVHSASADLGPLATAWVDLDAIATNVRVLAVAARGASLMAVVKADA